MEVGKEDKKEGYSDGNKDETKGRKEEGRRREVKEDDLDKTKKKTENI